MTPIVFCASLPPWPIEYALAENSCAMRNVRSTRCGRIFRNNQ
jgi:hypothetical protein